MIVGLLPDLDLLSKRSEIEKRFLQPSTGWAKQVDQFLIQFNKLNHFWLNNHQFQLKTFLTSLENISHKVLVENMKSSNFKGFNTKLLLDYFGV